jgi:DNA-binding PadR family transcriptional regulator
MIDFTDCPCSGKTLARLVQPAIMCALATGSMHGYKIAQKLSKHKMFKDAPPDPTGVYRMLRSMEEAGNLKSSWDTHDAGPARRLYQLTPSGKLCLKQWKTTLEIYASSIRDLLNSLKKCP